MPASMKQSLQDVLFPHRPTRFSSFVINDYVVIIDTTLYHFQITIELIIQTK